MAQTGTQGIYHAMGSEATSTSLGRAHMVATACIGAMVTVDLSRGMTSG